MAKWQIRIINYLRRCGLRAIAVFCIFLAFLIIFLVRIDPDFGWALESGRYFMKYGIPDHDVFTYTASSFSWIDHEWLSDVLIAKLMSWGGYSLIAAMFAAIWTGALVLASGKIKWPVLAIGFAAVAADVVARSNAWTALFLAGLLLLLRQRNVQRWKWVLVPYFALWANLHGGFVLGLLALGIAAFTCRELRLVWLGAILATFANPYGPRLYVEIWRTLSDSQLHRYIGEWQPLSIGILSGFYIIIFLLIGSVGGWRRAEMLLPTLVLISAVSAERQFTLFVVASLGLVRSGYSRFEDFLNASKGWRALLLPITASFFIIVPVYRISLAPLNSTPLRAVSDLRQTPCTRNLFNEYDFGGYILWQLPGTKVFIDGRMPSWKDGNTYYLQIWMKVLGDGRAAKETFTKYNIGCALLEPKHSRLIKQLELQGWQVSSADKVGILLRRPIR